MANLDILSQRYATDTNDIFSERQINLDEREFWIAVMKEQKKLGVDIPGEDIEKFERAKHDIDLDRIKEIELERGHDVKAKMEAFIEIAGAGEYLHQGLTARGLTDNTEQGRIKRGCELIYGRNVAIAKNLADRAIEYSDIVIPGRSHHQPAQPTLLGKRIAMHADELLEHLAGFRQFIDNYKIRGIKGAMGTQSDMLKLLGSAEKVDQLERAIARHLGFDENNILDTVGQVYPRSMDYALLSQLAIIGAASENYAKNIRLMAGAELVTEGFKPGQTGSTAMPHKMNTRSSERICGFGELLKMYADGASRISGDQWEEGDVSCSVVRRVVIPSAFYASDGLCETTLTVLHNMGAYPAVCERELNKYLPFLVTTQFLMTAVQAGIGREEAHAIIKEYAVSEALKIRQDGKDKTRLTELLAHDPVFLKAGVTGTQINRVLEDREQYIGNARRQINTTYEKVLELVRKFPEQANYKPKNIL